MLHGNDLHEVHPLMLPVLKKSNGRVEAQVAQAALVEKPHTHILDVPCSHPVVHLMSRQQQFVSSDSC